MELEGYLLIQVPCEFLAGVEGFEPSRTVLETGMLPLTSYPYVDLTNIIITYILHLSK